MSLLSPKQKPKSWKWAVLAALPIVLLSLGPQMIFWYDRGSQWQGTYATLNADEFLYSGYLNSLIDGEPRRNDPFIGEANRTVQLPETAFSIQLIPPFLLSTITKALGISAATAFIALAPIAALLSSLSIFWLLSSVTGNHKVAATGTIFVLLAGTLCAGQGLIGVLLKLDTVALGLPFLRRYQPAASFCLLFVFCNFTWLALSAPKTAKRRIFSLLGGVTLGILTFCYFYLWTTAVAWLVCLAILWLVLRPTERRSSLEVFGITATIFTFALVPYSYLLSNRASTLDELQTLISTRQPDLFRVTEILGAIVLVLLIIGLRRKRIMIDDRRALFAASLAMTPIIVFNQQIITGKSMQPFHYEVFVVSYVSLISLVILLALLWRPLSSSVQSWIVVICILLGATEVALAAGGFHRTDVVKDQLVPAARKLDALARQNPSSARSAFVFSPHIEFMQILPTWAPQGTLLGMGAVDFGGITHRQRKEYLFAHLYYSGVTAEGLRELIVGTKHPIQFRYYVKYVIFGHERVRPVFTLNFQPITQSEIENELEAYKNFVETFSRTAALNRPLGYAVIIPESNFDFSIIDRWYHRDIGQRVEDSMVYSLTLRD